LTLISENTSLALYKNVNSKKNRAGNLEIKILKLASKNIIFDDFGAERGSSQFFMTDSFFQSKNTHSGQISCF
jgi:hypothetical protein